MVTVHDFLREKASSPVVGARLPFASKYSSYERENVVASLERRDGEEEAHIVIFAIEVFCEE